VCLVRDRRGDELFIVTAPGKRHQSRTGDVKTLSSKSGKVENRHQAEIWSFAKKRTASRVWREMGDPVRGPGK
jgi:hypothetical protein